jgi:hypothetical protein
MLSEKQRKSFGIMTLTISGAAFYWFIQRYGVPKEDKLIVKSKKPGIDWDNIKDPSWKHENHGKWMTDTSFLENFQHIHDTKQKIIQVESGLTEVYHIKGRAIKLASILQRLNDENVPGKI